MIEIKIPEVGESVQEALLAQWARQDGDSVRKDDVLLVIETEKVTFEISAPADGILKILVPEGQTVRIGTVVGQIDESAEKGRRKKPLCRKRLPRLPKRPENRRSGPPPNLLPRLARKRPPSRVAKKKPLPGRSSHHRCAPWPDKRV